MKAKSRKEQARSNPTNILRVAIVLLFLGLAVWAITLNRYDLVIADREPWLWLTVALVSVGPELAGIVIGVVTIDYLNERRQREQLKAQFIRQMGSNIRDVAVPAARELAHHGWLYDGSLSGANLDHAELSGANLIHADLDRAGLNKANLSEANLEYAYLRNAELNRANLSRADLSYASVTGAFLCGSNLREAALIGTDLRGANLQDVDLAGATLEHADLMFTRLVDAKLPGARLMHAKLCEADLIGANLKGANLEEADLSGAFLYRANLSGAILELANLSEADLEIVDLSGATLELADLRGARNWTIKQLEQIDRLEGATMPDGVQLNWERNLSREPIIGPTFEEWKAQYLAKQEAERG